MKNDAVSETIKTYEETAGEFCKNKEHFEVPIIEELADYFIQNLKGKKILDIGCGPGRDSRYFSEKGLDVTGIDAAANFIKIASKNAQRAKFVKMDMRNLDFPEKSFDGIWACASFLHIPKAEAKDTLSEFSRVLKTSGLLHISVKEGAEEKFISKEEYLGHRKFFAFYAESEFKKLIASCGFAILNVVIDKKKDTWINVFAVKN